MFFYLLFLIIKILIIIVPLLISVAYSTLAERKIMGSIQRRRGPNVVGYLGLLQPLADGLKLFVKETILPTAANTGIFILAPLLTFILSLMGWAVIPFGEGLVLSNINVGVLYLFAVSSLSVYGIVLSGWSSNSKYAFLGGLRSAAQMISYEVSIVLMLWALAIMGFKLGTLINERKLLDANLISLQEGMRILPEDTREFERQIEILSEKQKAMVLPRALLNVLRRFSATKNIQDVSVSTHTIFFVALNLLRTFNSALGKTIAFCFSLKISICRSNSLVSSGKILIPSCNEIKLASKSFLSLIKVPNLKPMIASAHNINPIETSYEII
jgi:hypothetical protein